MLWLSRPLLYYKTKVRPRQFHKTWKFTQGVKITARRSIRFIGCCSLIQKLQPRLAPRWLNESTKTFKPKEKHD